MDRYYSSPNSSARIAKTGETGCGIVARMENPPIVIVVAMGKGRALGKGDKLLWHIPDDLKRFKALTKGHPVILGRKTFESIVGYIGKPLPERTNIVLTRDTSWTYPGVIVVRSLEEAFAKARELNPKEIHIGGGATLYEQVLPQVNKLYLTLIDDTKEADSFFPPYEQVFTKKVSEEKREYNSLQYTWLDIER